MQSSPTTYARESSGSDVPKESYLNESANYGRVTESEPESVKAPRENYERGQLAQDRAYSETVVEAPEPRNLIRDVNIRQLNYGYVVTIGCQSFAVETPEKILTNLHKYMQNPDSVERHWLNRREL